jgi:hypothetical protein
MLPQLRVASPCTADWEKMTGDDRVRYCDQCKLSVYNFSEMSASEIEQLLRKSTGRVCGRLYQRYDGTTLTKDCPVGFRTRVRQVSRVAGAVLAAMMSAAFAAAQNPTQASSDNEVAVGNAGINLTVVDPSGAVVPKASITISDVTGARVLRGQSDSEGSYEISNLMSGSWRITVSSPGFGHQELRVILSDREIFKSVIHLQVAIMGEVVEVPGPDLAASVYSAPDNLLPSKISPDTAAPPRKPSHNPISGLLHKLHL